MSHPSNQIKQSLAMQERAKKRIPGMTQLLSKRPDMFSLGVWPGYYERAAGAYIWDLDGNRYLDMSISGIGANVLGYADPDVDERVAQAIRSGSSSTFNCPEEVLLAEMLAGMHPCCEMSRFTRSGGEAMAVAVRIARAHTGRDVVAFCGYHGWHDWYLAANVGTGDALGNHLISGLAPEGVPSCLAGTALPFRFNHIEELESIVSSHGKKIAAIILEPLRNKAPNDSFVRAVREAADETGAVLVIDEISSGFRMNTGGAHALYGYDPDMVVFSKAMGNGYPIGAVCGKGTVMESAQKSFISSTCWTERVGPSAALAMIEKHKSLNVGSHLMETGKAIQEGWSGLFRKHSIPASVSGIYPLSHFDIEHELSREIKAFFVQEMLEKEMLASTIFYPMLSHTEEHVEKYLEAAEEVFGMISQHLEKGTLVSSLRGKPSSTGFQRLT